MVDFNDPMYGTWSPQNNTAAQLPGILGASQQQGGGGVLGGGQPSIWRQLLDPQVALPMAAALIGGKNVQESLAGAVGQMGPGIAASRKRMAWNSWLKAKSSGDQQALKNATDELYAADPTVAQNIGMAAMMPHPLVSVAPGARLADAWTGKFADGGDTASGRGDGSPYDVEQASKAYDYQFGPAANRAIDAPDPQAWYKSAWPTYGLNGGGGQPPAQPAQPPDQGASPQGASPQGAGGLPKRAVTEADTLRWDRASNAAVKNYIENPAYKLVANGAPFLARIDAAAKLPGSAVVDQELLDSVTKLNTGGGQVTEAQVNLVTKGASLTDKINTWKQYMSGNGGVLSPDQRRELVTLSHKVFGEYQKQLTPYYQDATRKLKEQGVPEQYWTIPDVGALSKRAGIVADTGGGAEGGITHTWDPQNGLRPVQ